MSHRQPTNCRQLWLSTSRTSFPGTAGSGVPRASRCEKIGNGSHLAYLPLLVAATHCGFISWPIDLRSFPASCSGCVLRPIRTLVHIIKMASTPSGSCRAENSGTRRSAVPTSQVFWPGPSVLPDFASWQSCRHHTRSALPPTATAVMTNSSSHRMYPHMRKSVQDSFPLPLRPLSETIDHGCSEHSLYPLSYTSSGHHPLHRII